MPLISKAFGDIITFTRASTGSYFDSAGVLQSAAINAPRLDYNPTTLAAQGLLIEEQRTNLVLQSEDLATTWTIGPGVTVSTNATTAPSGTTTADKLQEDNSTGSHLVSQNITFTAAFYTASVFAKRAERDWIRILFFDGTNTFTGFFNLLNGTVGTLTGTGTTATIAAVGNGWYRCTVTATTAAGSGSFAPRIALADNNSSYTGVTGNGIYIWGAQIEAGAFSTSYIPTTTVAVTRSADVASVNTLSPWYNTADSTVYTEFLVPQLGRAGRLIAFDDGTVNNMIDVTVSASNGVALEAVAASVYGGFVSASSISANTTQKAAFIFSTSTTESACLNAGTVGTASVTLPTATFTRLLLGKQSNGTELCGYLRRITYYPRRLSNAELQAITA